MTILIVSYSNDAHIERVQQALYAQQRKLFRLNLDEFPVNYQCLQQFSPQQISGHIANTVSGELLNFADISAVWLRKPAKFKFATELTTQEREFATQESEHFIFGMLFSLDCFWLSHPLAMRSAQWKGEQQIRARRFGFDIPPSTITNAPEAVRQFKSAVNSDIVYKAMSSAELAADKVDVTDIQSHGVGTTIIDETLMDNIEAVSIAPCHFQQFIDKKAEIRVTVVGERIFAAKMFSPTAATFVDSRNFAEQLSYAVITLPADIASRCIEMTKSYGLNYSAIDLLLTQDGQLQFLELNPNGQFLYIEQLLPDLPISGAVAELLSRNM
mgnify:FL=1